MVSKREKKISESELSFASNWRLKSGAFGSRLRKQKSGYELRDAKFVWRKRRNWCQLVSAVHKKKVQFIQGF